MAGWHHGLNGHEFEQAPGVGDGQESLVYCSPRNRKELDVTEQLNRTEHVSGGSVVKNTSANSGDMSFITGSRSFPGGRNGNPLQYSCWEVPGTEEPSGLQTIGSQSWTGLSDLACTRSTN